MYARGAGACCLPHTPHTCLSVAQITMVHLTCLQHQGLHQTGMYGAIPGISELSFHKLNAHINTDTPISPTIKGSEIMTWRAYGLCIAPTPTLLNVASMVFTPYQDRFIFDTHFMAVITGVLDEKASASQVLGSYPEHTGALYAPHIEETLNMLIKMGNYFHCQVREQAYTSLPLLFTATHQAFPAQPSGRPSTLALLLVLLITLPAVNILGQA